MNGTTIDNNLLRQIFFIAVIILLGLLLFNEMVFFLPPFLGSVTFYIVMRNRMFYLVEKKSWRRTTAATILMLLSFFIILVPIGLLGNILYSKVSYVVTHSGELMNTLKATIAKISQNIGYRIIDPASLDRLGDNLAQLLPKVLGVTFNTIAQIAAMYFILFFMLVNGRSMEKAMYEYIPLKDANVERIGKEVRVMVISNTIAIPLIALLQGVVALLGYLVIGVDEPWLWFVATTLTAMLPVVGAAIVYGPLTIMLFVQGHTGQGIALGIWGFGVVGLVDNLFRFLLNKKIGNIHPLITVFGVIVGIQLFGFIGLIFGPLLISLFILLLRIYSSEFISKRREIQRVK